jgi:hypothetical protein
MQGPTHSFTFLHSTVQNKLYRNLAGNVRIFLAPASGAAVAVAYVQLPLILLLRKKCLSLYIILVPRNGSDTKRIQNDIQLKSLS